MLQNPKPRVERTQASPKGYGFSAGLVINRVSTSEVIPSPEELVGMFFKWTDPPDSQNGFAVLPYIKGVTEPLTRILNNNGIRATTRPVKTLQQEFASPKSRPPSDRQTNVVYKIPKERTQIVLQNPKPRVERTQACPRAMVFQLIWS